MRREVDGVVGDIHVIPQEDEVLLGRTRAKSEPVGRLAGVEDEQAGDGAKVAEIDDLEGAAKLQLEARAAGRLGGLEVGVAADVEDGLAEETGGVERHAALQGNIEGLRGLANV